MGKYKGRGIEYPMLEKMSLGPFKIVKRGSEQEDAEDQDIIILKNKKVVVHLQKTGELFVNGKHNGPSKHHPGALTFVL